MKPYYDHGGITLYHADCRDVLPTITVGVIITDAPYGVTDHEWDTPIEPNAWMRGPAVVTTATEPFATGLIVGSPLPFRFDLVWVKNCTSNHMNADRMPLRRHERVLVFGEPEWHPITRERSASELARLNKTQREKHRLAQPDSVLEFDSVNCRSGERTEHPSQKPVALMSWLIRSFSSGLVLDPFCGTGATLVAAKALGRQAIGIEKNERFAEITAKRLAQEVFSFP